MSMHPQGYIDPNFPNPHGGGDARYIIYGYRPSFALAVVAIVLFTLSLILHAVQLYLYRTYYFSIPIIVGILMEIIGYVFRSLSSQVDPYLVVYFVVQYFFIVVAPVLFSAALYALLSYYINLVGPQYSPVLPPKWIIIVFVTCDVVATGIQIAGAASIGVAESNRKDPTTANNILLVGLAVQVASYLVFLVLFAKFLSGVRHKLKTALRQFTIAMVVVSLLIYLRTCFRLAETAEGVYSFLSTHEGYFAGLEFTPIILAVFILNAWSPGKWLKRGNL